MTAAPAARVDLAALTGLRGIAAWYVVLYHVRLSASTQLPPELVAILAKGYLAVDLFFMLSGFVLWLNYAEKLHAGGLAAIPNFLAGRIARIWPLHLFVLSGAVLFAGALALAGKLPPERYPLDELPLHLLLVHNWGFTGTLSWNVPSWSISCEFAAYLLFPLLVLSLDWHRLPAAAAIGAILLLAALLAWTLGPEGWTNLGHHVPRFGLVRALTEFAMGTAVCGLWLRWRHAPFLPSIAAALLTLTLAALGIARILPESLAAPLAFAGLLLTIALNPSNLLAARPLRYLGEISYATYLSHYLLFILFKLLFVADQKAVPLLLLGAFLLLTVCVSMALYHLVEMPAQKTLNRALSRRTAPPPAVSTA